MDWVLHGLRYMWVLHGLGAPWTEVYLGAPWTEVYLGAPWTGCSMDWWHMQALPGNRHILLHGVGHLQAQMVCEL